MAVEARSVRSRSGSFSVGAVSLFTGLDPQHMLGGLLAQRATAQGALPGPWWAGQDHRLPARLGIDRQARGGAGCLDRSRGVGGQPGFEDEVPAQTDRKSTR